MCILPITVTKGGRPRSVTLPASVYDELIQYVDSERGEAVRGHRHPTTALFVNHATATRNAGGPVTPHTVTRNFNRAVFAAGLIRTVDADPPRRIAAHTFHDLRHTYAVATYFALQKAGKAEPWMLLKTLLGHRSVATTLDIYLRSVSNLEAATTDLLADAMRFLTAVPPEPPHA